MSTVSVVRTAPVAGQAKPGRPAEKLPEFELGDFLDQECRKQGGRSLPSVAQLMSEEERLFHEMGKIVRQGSQKGASAAEMARALTGELKEICDHGYYEGQVGSHLLRAVDNDIGNGCAYRRGDAISVRGPGEPQGRPASAASLLEDAGHALRSEHNRWSSLRSILQGSFQCTDYVPHEGGLIDRLEKGDITSRQAAREIDRVLSKGYTPYGGEAFEGVSPNAGPGYLRKVLGEENYSAAFHPEGFIAKMNRQLDNVEITIGKGQDGKPVSTPEAVRDCLANGDPLPAGVTVKYRPDLGERAEALKDRVKSWVSGWWRHSVQG